MAEWLKSVGEVDLTPGGEVFGSPGDWRDQVIYHLLIDRFDDGRADRPAYQAGLALRGRDEKEGAVFQGGTLRGITRRLDYIRNLGCGAIWISPPFKNRQDDPHSYHGYGIQDFLRVDPRFGGLEDLRELVRKAHRRGMYVILDIVVNHTGDVWAYAGNKPQPFNEKGRYELGFWRKKDSALPGLGEDDAVWPVELQRPECFTRRGHIRHFGRCGEEEAIHGDFYSLKDLNLDDARTLEAITRVYQYWIAAADVDGYRVDAVRHVKGDRLAEFCRAVREYARSIGKKNFLIFGEIMGDDALLRKYMGDVRDPHLDAVLDFPLYGVLEEVIKGSAAVGSLRERYEAMDRYGCEREELARRFVTFVDNHDQTYRPCRRFLHGAKSPRLAAMAAGYLLTAIGIPCLYYGTEQGFDGGGKSDRFVRECMFGGKWGAFGTTGGHFFNEQHPLYRAIGDIARVRAGEPALRYGRQVFRETSAGGVLAFSRVMEGREVLVVMNRDASPGRECVAVDADRSGLGGKMIDLLGGEPGWVEQHPKGRRCVRVMLEGYGMKILKVR